MSTWEGTASASADGQKLFVAGQHWSLPVSTNAGSTWTTNTEPQAGGDFVFGSWTSIACSADGNTQAAINLNAYWVSTNSGATWVSNTVPGVSFFSCVAMSPDGTKWVLADGTDNAGLIYISTNSGATVTPAPVPAYNWTGVASSADGTKLYATGNDQSQSITVPHLYASTNSGQSWAEPTGLPPNTFWSGIACSVDGTRLIAIGIPGIYTSTNGGATWTANNVPPNAWAGVASSADGTRLVASSQNWIYTSTNAGASWISNNVPDDIWQSVASSADGGVLVAGPVYSSSYGFYPPFYFSQTTVSPCLNLSACVTSTNLMLSWIVPSTNFIVQQSADLTSWADLSVTPVLNLTNLQDQIGSAPCQFHRFLPAEDAVSKKFWTEGISTGTRVTEAGYPLPMRIGTRRSRM